MTVCTVCEVDEFKYKCPKCYIRYCSVACYRRHQSSNSCDERVFQNSALTSNCDEDDDEDSAQELDDPMIDYVPLRRLELLKSSSQLKKLLTNHHLRTYLKKLDNSRRPDLAIERAMREPLFVEFADECLRIISDE